MSAPAGYRFPREVIAVAARWYLRYSLSYRDVEELLAERGVKVDHVTVYRWVQTFTPELIDAARPARHARGDRWFVDEVRHEAPVRREALKTEGGVSPPRRVVAAAR
jgi:transposase-like protein